MMLCTKCSTVVRPIVAVDIDGTLADYHGHFIKFASQYLGMPTPRLHETYDGIGSFRDWFCNEFNVEADVWYDIKLSYRQGGQKRSQPIFPHARELILATREADAEVWLTTTRPYLRLDGIDPDTRFWLEFHGIDYDGLLYDEYKYVRLTEHVDKRRVVAILDDLPEQYDSAVDHYGIHMPILVRGTYNRNITRPTMVSELTGAKYWILKRIKEWYERNGSR